MDHIHTYTQTKDDQIIQTTICKAISKRLTFKEISLLDF